MKRHGLLLTRRENQRGLNIMDAVMGMMIASLVATAVITGITSWFNTRNLASNQDSATQYAQGIIAKAKVGSWTNYGFPGSNTKVRPIVDDPKYAFCATTPYSGAGKFRANVNGETTVLTGPDQQPAEVYPVDVVVLRGQAFCVRTDITWATPPSVGAAAANANQAYGVKHITMKLSWQERGKPKFITVDSTRSPNVGESIPSSIGVNDHAVLTPAVSNQTFNVLEAKYNAIKFGATWKDAVSAKIVSSNADTFSNPATIYTVPDPATNTLTWTKDYGTTVPTDAYYRLLLTDSIGLVTPVDLYQFPGSKLTINQSTKVLSWNTYGGLGTPTYNVMMSSSPTFSNPTKLATVSGNSFNAPVFTGDRWFRIDTVNSQYALPTPALSNVAQLTRPLVQPILTCVPNSYSMDMNFKWQNWSNTWGGDITATLTVQNNTTSSVLASNTNVTGKSNYLQDVSDSAATGTYTATMTVTTTTGATSSGNVTCALPKFEALVGYDHSTQTMTVTSTLTYAQLGFGVDSPSAYTGTDFTKAALVTGSDYFNNGKSYPTLTNSESGTFAAINATDKPSVSTKTPITGGEYTPSLKLDLPAGTVTTRTATAASTIFPYRDYSVANNGKNSVAGVQNDALTFYDMNDSSFASSPTTSYGVGWNGAKNVSLGQNTTSYETSSIWAQFSTKFYRYDMNPDPGMEGHTIGKIAMTPNGIDLFTNHIMVQNFFGDERPAILAIASRTDYGWNAGDLLAYKVLANGDLAEAQLVGWGWKNYTIAPMYDWNGYGTSGLLAFKGNDKANAWVYNISPEGKSASPANIINSRVALGNTASTPSIHNYHVLAWGGHDDSGRPMVLLTEGVAPFVIQPGVPANKGKYNAMIISNGVLASYVGTNAPTTFFEAQSFQERRWMQGNFASAVNGNYCLDLGNNDTTNGNKYQVYSCNQSSAQEFKWNGSGALIMRDSPDKCLDVPGNNSNPSVLQVYDCNGTAAQHFVATKSPIGSQLYTIKHQSSGLCLSIPNNNAVNQQGVATMACNGSYGQAWGFPWNNQ